MEIKNGRTFWDLVHENKSIQYSLIAIVVLSIIGVVFFLSKGYTISTSGITPPHDNIDTISIKKDSISLLTKPNDYYIQLINEKINSTGNSAETDPTSPH